MKEPCKRKSILRLKKTRGQIEAVIKMIENEVHHPEVMTQILALQGALKGVSLLILESRLSTYTKKNLSSRDIEEILQLSDLIRR